MNLTCLIVTFNQPLLVKLAVESLRRYNTDVGFQVWLWSNDDTDADRRWYEEHCDRVFFKSDPLGHYHGQPLDRMAQEVTTEFVLTCDNDVNVRGPILSRLLDTAQKENAFCVCSPPHTDMGVCDHFGRQLIGQPRIDPAFALFRTHELARLTRHVSFTPYECTNLAKFYDTGGLLYAAAQGAGLKVVGCPEIAAAVLHYGAMTWARPNQEPAVQRQYTNRMARIQRDWMSLEGEMNTSKEVVIARYRESADWYADLQRLGIPYKVYDKSGEAPAHHVALPNVGREAQTYAEHVARNYADLAEVTVFCQGNPFDHAPNFLDEIRTPTAGFQALGPHRLTTTPAGDNSHTGLPIGETYRNLVGYAAPPKMTFAPGAQFVAHKSRLQRYPQGWWARLAEDLARPETQGHAPWVMERLWQTLLSRPPLEHIYTKIVGWFDTTKLYERMVKEARDGAVFVEVGSWVGRSASFMAVEILNAHKQIQFDVVDSFRGSSSPGEQFMRDEAERNGGTVRSIFETNVAPVRQAISNVHEMTSVEAAKLYADGSIDFLFIDAGHSEEEVTADVKSWLPKLRPGGVVAGDDFTGAWPGVIAAVTKAFGDNVDVALPPFWVYRVPA